ncbi:MAG: alpha-L-rhamnosidase C-terminal domain-containing protein [Gammaproteobacteria bacterium]
MAATPFKTHYILPTRVLWQSAHGVAGALGLLASELAQPIQPTRQTVCLLQPHDGAPAGVLLDFGLELQGCIEITTYSRAARGAAEPRVRVRFGESASEAMAELGHRGAGNDYAIRDEVQLLPWLGTKTIGPGGFRFVRIDALDAVSITHVRAVHTVPDIPRAGAFRCSDVKLDTIWDVGAYTVELNAQSHLWDGIKRDRLVWMGDVEPTVRTICAVHGYTDVVPRSLDLVRDHTPRGAWMNGISSFSLWWVLIQETWWLHCGDFEYLESQRGYLLDLLAQLVERMEADGSECLDGMRFLNWPTYADKQATAAGLQALLVMAFEAGARLAHVLGDAGPARQASACAVRARARASEPFGSKSAAAMQVLAAMSGIEAARRALLSGGARGISAFGGSSILRALGYLGETRAALDVVRAYWGGMIERGATTFWEEFDVDWLEGSGRIDELTPPGKTDLHGDYGEYGYSGFRKSLCHAWASGPTAWLSEHVLGVTPLLPGCARVRIAPNLGDLAWAEGSYPTPRGPLRVRHKRVADDLVHTTFDAPFGVEVVLAPQAEREARA